jgi:protein TonB
MLGNEAACVSSTTGLPHYAEIARSTGVEGSLLITLQVDDEGRVVAAKFDRLLGGGLDEEVLRSARSMRFAPATRCGKPVPAEFRMRMNFLLRD